MDGAALPGTDAGLDRYRPDAYEVQELAPAADVAPYLELLAAVYEPLGFMTDKVLPAERSRCFVVRYRGQVVAIFRLTEVTRTDSPFHRWLPAELRQAGARWIEVNNVVIGADFRATALLGVVLYRCACIAREGGYAAVVGITRWQTLRFFVDFGVVPVDHPPLHLLGRPDLKDFIIYYNTGEAEAITYLHLRAHRWFHQQYVMRRIQLRCREQTPIELTPLGVPPVPIAAAQLRCSL